MTLSLNTFFSIVTDIGDSACLLAIVSASSIYLISRRSGRATAFLCFSLLLAALLIGLLKLVFTGCHSHFHIFNIHSPSGHAACSTAVFWSYAMLMRSQLPEHRRFLPLLLLSLLIAAIAISRVWLEYHTTAEVILGIFTGILGIFLARFLLLRGKSVGAFDAYALALWGVIAGIIVHGAHLPVENIVHSLAVHMRGHIPFCGTDA